MDTTKAKRALTPEQKIAAKTRHDRWVATNRDKLNANVRAYRARRYARDGCWLDSSPKATALKSWMLELKAGPCADCGRSYPSCCMDFDHREGTAKAYNVGSMFAHHYSMDLIKTEIEKCDLVCSNCHRVRTRDRKKGSGKHGNKHTVHAIPENSTPQG